MFDYNKPAKELLLELIFYSNGILFNEKDITFGTPQVLDQRPEDLTDENTFVPFFVPDTVDNRYEGRTGFLYRRAALEDLPPVVGAPPIQIPSYPCTTLDILTSINAHFDIQLTEDDVEDLEYADGTVPITVKFKESSLCWQGQSGPLTTVYTGLVSVTKLSGFREYSLVGGRRL